MTESLLLATLGGVFGILIAAVSLEAIVAIPPRDLPRIDEIGIDSSMLAFAFLLTTLTAFVFGIVPAWHCSGQDFVRGLGDAGGRLSRSRRQTRIGAALVLTRLERRVSVHWPADLLELCVEIQPRIW